MDKINKINTRYIKKINPKHRAIMRQLVAGRSKKEMSIESGLTESRVTDIIASPVFKAELEEMKVSVNREFAKAEGKKLHIDRTRERLTGSSEKAAITLDNALEDNNVHGRINAAKDILDRTGYGKEEKVRAHVLVEPSEGLIDVIKRISKEEHGSAEFSQLTETSTG